MPANLPTQYVNLEKQYREAKNPREKLSLLEEMLSVIPKHKGTDKLQADLKKRISKLKTQDVKSGASRTSGYHIKPEGAGQVVLVGPPNSGKSSLLASLTRAEPDIADYPFSTRTPLAGMLRFEDINIQLVDLPPISSEYIEPWVFDQIRRADLVLLLLDLTDDPLHQLRIVEDILAEKRIYPEDAPPRDLERRGAIKRFCIAVNKLDDEQGPETLDLFLEMLDRHQQVLPLSAKNHQGLEQLAKRLFNDLKIIRAYSKMPGKPVEERPHILPQGAVVADMAESIHKDMVEKMKFARLWRGRGTEMQTVQRDYHLQDGDVVEIHT